MISKPVLTLDDVRKIAAAGFFRKSYTLKR